DITAFLTAFNDEVLEPELAAEGFSRRVTATQATVVLGDLHGQLFNLLAFLRHLHQKVDVTHLSLLPASKLFICDPKLQSSWAITLIVVNEVWRPSCNHEASSTNDRYGFSKEVEYKLDKRSLHSGKSMLWSHFNDAFWKLPFVAGAKGMFMATHGGISPKLVKACWSKRGHFRSCLGFNTDIGSEMVWSDPHKGSGWARSQRGGEIYNSGRDIASKFLWSNGLKRLLRGHEQMAKGISTLPLDAGGESRWHVLKLASFPCVPPKSHLTSILEAYNFAEEYFVHTIFSAADYVGTFCVDKTNSHPLRLPAWDPEMFNGGMMVVNYSTGRVNYHEYVLSGHEARKLAQEFTGSECHHNAASMRTTPTTTTAEETEKSTETEEPTDSETTTEEDPLELTDEMEDEETTTQELPWKDRLQTFFGLSLLEELVHGPETEQIELPIHCSDHLSQEEAQEHEEYVRSSLLAAENMQLEARKIIDLQGEAAVCEGPEEAISENCKAMARDVITLKVFTGLKGSKQVLEDLEHNIVAREEEVEGVVGKLS
ncbi:unnamed protein product, partial [Symbiodinium sp. CCMP2456]